jgi:hypothetical protein
MAHGWLSTLGFPATVHLAGLLLLRLLRILPKQSATVIAAAVLFSNPHLPGLVLTMATLA